MSTAEIIWGWTQFALNVILILSGIKVVWDLSRYSTIRCKILHMKVRKAGVKLQQEYLKAGCFASRVQVHKFQDLVTKLLVLDPKAPNPFDPKNAQYVFSEYENARKIYKATYHGPKK